MSSKRKTSPETPSDLDLLQQLASGDNRALAALMDRYDRLVRFTVFRCSKVLCLQDPSWLDGVASEVWSSLVFSARRREVQAHQFRTYLIQIARFKTIDAVRRQIPHVSGESVEESAEAASASLGSGVDKIIEAMDEIRRVQDAVARLSEEEREICSQIQFIVDRQWREAGQRLGMAESTIRSKWPKILDRLRGFILESDA